MKKYFLSIFTIIAFIGYAVYEQGVNPPAPQSDNQLAVVADVGRPGRPVVPGELFKGAINAPVVATPTTNDQSNIPAPVTAITVPKTTPKPVTRPTPIPTPAPVITGKFKDGTYDGDIADVYYGLVQVQAVIRNGKLVDVVWLNYPQENPTSQSKSARARPILISEAIAAQDAQVDRVSGASATSGGFVDSLASALAQAKA